MDDITNELIASALRAIGTPYVPYATMLGLVVVARRESYVVRTVEAWEFLGDDTYRARRDASHHYQRDADRPDWRDTVQRSADFVDVALSDVRDKEALYYTVWFDDGGKARSPTPPIG